ncbi:trichohyalin-like isoform X1 [Mercenaria mercenaria]|uniref:trichohyalin-like isoform X1 n=1 Tax=Mercenaria mercenaria TaxID=6596 RepID=UPI00234F6DDA|nr:trichohyalin-like isoform X1 [Mercenaria mercenaria]XP_053387095.1 trichohyalin-like isoform X1 [Mercenaria mercenaria]
MSNVSIGGNTGNSINFDAAALQNQQEDEYRKEEEQQQNELRALLTNAFDDLIDDDDILSITSDDGTDSRNVSLVRRHSNDSLGRMISEENKITEQPEETAEWRKFNHNAGPQFRQGNPNHVPQPRYAQFEPMSRTQEIPRGQFDLLRASVESLPNFPTNQNGLDRDINSNASVHGSRDHLDSDYHSNAEDNQNADFHGNVYPLPSGQGHQGAAQGHQDAAQGHGLIEDHQTHHHNNTTERENILRQSVEDFAKFKEVYQSQEHLFTHHAPVGHDSNIQGHQGHQHYHAAEHPYDQGHGGQGHYYHHDQGQPVYHHGYEGHYPPAHHHFRNIYRDRPYHTIGEREETEGGNAHQGGNMHYYHHGYNGGHVDHGFQGNQMLPQGQGHEYNVQGASQDHGFHSHVTDKNEHVKNHHSKTGNTSTQSSSSNGRKLPQVTYRFQNISNDAQDKQKSEMTRNREKENIPQKENTEAYADNYKVRYEKEHERKREEISQREKEGKADKNMEAEFMEQVGSGENQQLAQLQILYKARGRRIEELTNEIEVVKSESGREIRILKHQLSVSKGEKEGSTKSLDSVQSLLQESKNENAQLVGRVHASESQIEGLKKAKEELIKKLQTAESTIETLHQHLEELGSSDTLTRARHDHEAVVGGLQKKYETEIKHLQENNEKLKQTVVDKNEEISILKQKLTDSIKMSETAQISRAETINRLTQSLEESQKRCRNLLEASSSQEMSQMKIHLQQALASRSISDEMCSSLQEEIQDLKEQVQMLESASHLGVSSVAGQSSSASNFVDQNDSMVDLGIRKTLDYDTPQGTPTVGRSQSAVSSSDIVTSLKVELERCLVSNKQKRGEVSELKEEMRKVKKDMMEFRQRCERAELLTQEQKKRIADLESCMSPGEKSNAIENRLKKDIDNLKREKKVLLEDTEELQRRLEEISKSEERLTELNRELSTQISDMVKEYDQDKREAVERAHRASEQVAETTRNKLRQELTLLFDAERSDIIAKYEKECSNLREELQAAQEEIDKVKDEYVKLCEEKENMKAEINKEWQEKLESSVQQVKDTMKKETELSVLRAEENWAKQKEAEISHLKEELVKEFTEEKDKLKDTIQSDCDNEQKIVVERLQVEHSAEMKASKERFEAELKTMRDILEMEKSNDLEKLDKEKVNEIEKLKKLIIDKELFISEKEQVYIEKENLLTEREQVIESLKSEYKANMDSFQTEIKVYTERTEMLEKELNENKSKLEEIQKELSEKSNQFEQLLTSLEEKDDLVESLKSEIEILKSEVKVLEQSRKEYKEKLEWLQKDYHEKVKEIESQKKETDSSVENILKAKTDEINRLKKELEKIESEKDSEIDKWRKEEVERQEVENLRKEIGKNIQKDRQVEMESLKKEVIRLKLEIDRMDSNKQMEVDKVCRVKQAEIDNIEKRKKMEIERLKKEKQIEIERLIKEKDEEISKWKSSQQERSAEEMDITEKVRERLNQEMEEDLNKTVETKVAMSKVVWLEEHRATRQAAIDNAVRLAETELRLKMEDELESKLEARLEEAKILWQSDSLTQLDDERRNWETLKEEEIGVRLDQEKSKWRQTELLAELEAERQKWSKEMEQRLVEEKESWREFELETEKLKWASDWERKLVEERDSWVKNTLEPAKRKLKMEAEERLRLEKENWRCMELETEKLKLMREYEERIAQEKQTFTNKTLPEVLDREKNKWKNEEENRLRKEKELWRDVELPKELEREKEKWYDEVEGKMREERNNWKNSDLPEEIEKERRKWMKLMEQTLIKEKENWKNRDLPAEVQKVKETLKQSAESELESRLVQKLEVEKEKLQKESEAKVLEAIEEHQEACKQELTVTINKEKERLKQKFEAELQERFQAEKKIWRTMVDQELSEKLEVEREKWKRKAESDLNKKLESEKERLRSWLRADMEKRLESERKELRETMEEEFDNQMKIEIDKLREKFEREAREDFEHLKGKFDMEREQEYERIKLQLESESQMNLDKEKELLQMKTDRELSRKLDSEQETWRLEFEKELGEKLQKEEQKWKQMIENDIEERLKKEKEIWESAKEKEIDNKLTEEKNKWRNIWNEEKETEMKALTEKVEDRMRADLDEEMEKVKLDVEHEFQLRVEHEVNLAVQEAKDDWNREYMMEMSINTTSAEASQGLLKEEIQSLKHQLGSVQTELIEKEAAWLKEKEDILLQKDLERRGALDSLQEQTENEYKQFLDEHKDMLDKALKAAREQHNKDKAELEERYTTQLKILQAREKSLQEQLQQSVQGTQYQHNTLADLEKEQVLWYEERERLLQEISDRDSLLGKADVHLSKEVDKLRSELQAAYQRRLEGEMNSWRQKLEAEFTRANNSEQKEKLQLEKQLSEVNTELNKLKTQLKEERGKHAEEVKKITDKLNEIEKSLDDKDRLEGELKKAKELLKGYKDELTDNQEKCEKYKAEVEEVTAKLNKSLQNQEKLQTEVQKYREEKSTNIETVQSIEASYRKDVSLYKQKLEESNSRIAKTEKVLHDMKHKYRAELESLRKALEAENDVAMNAMKNKMIEIQKKHVAIVDEMKRKHQQEREEFAKHGQSAVGRGVTPTPNTAEVEEIDLTVKELRSQYLDTVAKIKGDVLRHITQTNVRAAETVKLEMDKERMTTFQQIKDFYRQNVKQILDTEIVGATLESKLLAVEEALENLSSNPSSRSATPKSDEFILDERQLHSRSRSASRDAGISPKGQRSVSFTSGTKGDRSRTPVNSGNDLSMSGQFEDPRSPKNRLFTKSPRDMNVTVRGDRNTEVPPLKSDLRSSYDWKYDDESFDTRRSENRPTSARTVREMRENDTRASENRPLSAKSPRELHLSLRQRSAETDHEESQGRERNRSGDKRRSRTLISTRDIHAGRYSRTADGGDSNEGSGYYNDHRAKSVTPMHSTMSRSSPSLYRPISVPDLSNEDKELKIWTETNNDTYRYTPLRETLRLGTNLHRSNSKSESDLSIVEKNFGPMKPEYDSNLDLSSGSLTSDSLFTPRKRDAGETPTSTPRRHSHRKHYTLHSFPTRDQISSDLRNKEQVRNDYRKQTQNVSRNDDVGVNSPVSSARTSKKNLPLIQFRQGKVQALARGQGTSSKSPHPEDGIIIRDTPPTRDTSGTPEKHYRPLSVSTNAHMDF